MKRVRDCCPGNLASDDDANENDGDDGAKARRGREAERAAAREARRSELAIDVEDGSKERIGEAGQAIMACSDSTPSIHQQLKLFIRHGTFSRGDVSGHYRNGRDGEDVCKVPL